MAVLDGKPTLMGGYDDDATPRNQNKVPPQCNAVIIWDNPLKFSIALMTFSFILEVIQYGMETDTWTELDQKLEAGRHHILTIPVPRCARSVKTTFRFF